MNKNLNYRERILKFLKLNAPIKGILTDVEKEGALKIFKIWIFCIFL